MPVIKTHTIGKALSKEMRDYGLKQRHVGMLADATNKSVSHWVVSRNGTTHERMQKLAFIFSLSLDQLCDDRPYVSPSYPAPLNYKQWVPELKEIINNRLMYDPFPIEFVADVNARIRKWEAENIMAPTPAAPKPVAPVPTTTDKETIRMFLHRANTFAKNNNLTWVVDNDGKLRAKRVTTEHF